MALELLRVVAMLIGRAVNLERKDIVAAPMRYKYVAILFSVIRQTIDSFLLLFWFNFVRFTCMLLVKIKFRGQNFLT